MNDRLPRAETKDPIIVALTTSGGGKRVVRTESTREILRRKEQKWAEEEATKSRKIADGLNLNDHVKRMREAGDLEAWAYTEALRRSALEAPDIGLLDSLVRVEKVHIPAIEAELRDLDDNA